MAGNARMGRLTGLQRNTCVADLPFADHSKIATKDMTIIEQLNATDKLVVAPLTRA